MFPQTDSSMFQIAQSQMQQPWTVIPSWASWSN